jgi:hypothetical protein
MDIQEQQERRTRVNTQLHAIRDLGWGVFYVLAGLFFLFHKQWGVRTSMLGRVPEIILGVLAPIYGIWRIVRGVQKKY